MFSELVPCKRCLCNELNCIRNLIFLVKKTIGASRQYKNIIMGLQVQCGSALPTELYWGST